MTTLFIMVGPQASGKTTWAKNFYGNLSIEGTYYVSRDEIRLDIVEENEPLFSKENLVFSYFCDKIAQHFHNGAYGIIADASHINYSARAKLIEELEKREMTKDKYEIIYVVMTTPYQECVRRDNLRTGRAHVTAKVIWDYFKVFIPPTKNEFKNIREIWYIE